MNFLSYFDQLLKYYLIFLGIKEHAIDCNKKFYRGTRHFILKEVAILIHLNIPFGMKFLLI